MRTFGDIYIFSLKYDFRKNPFNEKGLIGETWGGVEFWVKGKELCGFYKDNLERSYEWNLIYIVEWLAENLSVILVEEEFPLPVQGGTTLELLNNSLNFDSEDDDEFDEWFSKKQDWEFKHSWFSSRGGAYLPDAFFRRIGDKMEISWNNDDLYEDISFVHMRGVELIPICFFESVVKAFIHDFMKILRSKTEYIDQFEVLSKKVFKNQT